MIARKKRGTLRYQHMPRSSVRSPGGIKFLRQLSDKEVAEWFETIERISTAQRPRRLDEPSSEVPTW